VRVPVADFAGSRTQRRLIRRNGDLTLSAAPARATVEQYRIFQAYQAARHRDSDMRRMGLADFAGMVNENRVDSVLYEARDGAGRLHACLLADRLDDGLSAVYSFFDPASPRQSLGTWLILALIAEARRLGLPHVYLGYWIADSRKMAYKGRFQPLEALGHDGWVRIAPPPPDPAVMVDPVPDWTEPDDYPDLFELEREITD
jgi:arginine-tRNA-protein transferase